MPRHMVYRTAVHLQIHHRIELIHLMKGLIEIRHRYPWSHKPCQKRHSPNLWTIPPDGTGQKSFSGHALLFYIIQFYSFSRSVFQKASNAPRKMQ